MREKIIEYIKKNRIEFVIISVITIFALLLRILLLQNYGDLWLDELYSWYFASQKTVFGTVFELIKQDLHMPLYFVILHFWIKLFGNSDMSMHLCSLTLAIPLIPLSFYLMKDLFNKTAGYCASIAFAVNTFCIYYSLEVRFYSLVFVLSLSSAYLFVKMLKNFDKEYVVGFVISQVLLIYTFSIAPLLTMFYGFVGGFYVLYNKKDYLKKYCKIIAIIFVFSIPSLIFTVYNFYVLKTQALSSFSKDIYWFNWKVIFDILENFFTCENFQITTGLVNEFRSFADIVRENNFYPIFVMIPIIIGISGLLKSILSKDTKLYLFLLPSILFLITILFLSANGQIAFLTKYSSIFYAVIICAFCYGLSLIEFKPIMIFTFALFVMLNSVYLFVSKDSILNLKRKTIGNIGQIFDEKIKISDDDLLLIPYSGNKVKKYISGGALIPFYADDAFLLKDKKSKEFYFNENLTGEKVTKSNVRDILHESSYDNHPYLPYEKNLYNNYFEKMKKGQKFVIVSVREIYIIPLNKNWDMLRDNKNYYEVNLFVFLMSKVMRDSVQIADKYLKLIYEYNDAKRDYSIYVYEKQ